MDTFVLSLNVEYSGRGKVRPKGQALLGIVADCKSYLSSGRIQYNHTFDC